LNNRSKSAAQLFLTNLIRKRREEEIFYLCLLEYDLAFSTEIPSLFGNFRLLC